MAESDDHTLATLPTTRKALLLAIKKAGEIGADELAAEFAITVSAVRQQLGGLAADGLIERRDERHGPGRPRHLYRLTELGDTLFPRTYSDLTTELLDYADQEDPARRAALRSAPRPPHRAGERAHGWQVVPRPSRVLTEILDEDGYLAELVEQPDGTFRSSSTTRHPGGGDEIRHGVRVRAGLHPRGIPSADVERVSHLLAGAHTCAYEVRPTPDAGRRRFGRPPAQ